MGSIAKRALSVQNVTVLRQTAFPFGGQTTHNFTGLSPQTGLRFCLKRVKKSYPVFFRGVEIQRAPYEKSLRKISEKSQVRTPTV